MDGAKSNRMRWLPKRGGGFTLVETMVAMVILSFGLIAMLAMMTAAMAGGRVGKHGTDAARIARDQLEVFHRIAWTDADMAPTGGFTPQQIVTSDVEYAGAAQQEMAYGLSWRITNHPTDTSIRLVDVIVTWQEGDDLAVAPIRRVAMSSARFNNP
ncbi:MAG: prepilin-type N-terminal cleavage/methylation domain-containing protein [Myxococcales bacterium]|nr:prepilin-type N-terminal cleavage/methylation domain-containing protein [Myxococcales bacterium]